MKQQLFKEYLIKYLWQPLLGIVISLLLTSIAWFFRELLIPSNILDLLRQNIIIYQTYKSTK
jgi:hypothetical protein